MTVAGLQIADAQVIAAISLIGTIATAFLTFRQNRFGKNVDRLGTLETRQSSVESNLLIQSTECLKRIDALQHEKAVSDAAFRAELEKGAKERRELERDFRAEIDRLEAEIKALEKRNLELEHENWLLLHGGIGGIEATPMKIAERKAHPLGDGDATPEEKKES